MKVIVAGPYPEDIQVAENVILLGKVSDQAELAKYYSLADVTLLASKKETFSMVTAESLACGTPVVGFQAGGPEQIAIPEYSSFVNYGDMDALIKTVEMFLGREFEGITISNAAREKYSKEKMTESYLKIYEEVGQTHLVSN